ncbi:hypothetical protein IWX50DRAFT_640302 [Phyllosticta citricarpa]
MLGITTNGNGASWPRRFFFFFFFFGFGFEHFIYFCCFVVVVEAVVVVVVDGQIIHKVSSVESCKRELHVYLDR